MKAAHGQGWIYRRGNTWWIQYHVNGKPYRESSKSSKEKDAATLLRKRLEAASKGQVTVELDKVTFEELGQMIVDDYITNGRRSIGGVRTSLRNLGQFFAGTRAKDITYDRLLAYVAFCKEAGIQNGTISVELGHLRRAFHLADLADKVSKVPHFPFIKVDNARMGFFEREHLTAVLPLLPEWLRPLFHAAYITGWRMRSELTTRKWHNVDLNAGYIRLEPGETKNGKGREFYFTPELRQLLVEQRERTKDLESRTGRIIPWVFHHDGQPIKIQGGDQLAPWHKACREAGLPGRIPHDFRRSAVRNLERAGVPRSAAMAMTGHLTESVYRRYAIVDSAMLKEGAAKLAKIQ